ncbi:MAG: chorismate mutase [Candidatus Delongbacteria bacterium]|jgi:chorismate mutase|nr:chorismate mutase [Candidatus Delongbacteria bacterium]
MKLEELRSKIDDIDEDIVKLLMERFEVVEQIMSLKSEIEDKNRENEILTTLNNLTVKTNNQEFFTKLYRIIFEESKNIQKELSKK